MSLTTCCYLSPGPILFWTSTWTQLLFWAWMRRPLTWTKSGTVYVYNTYVLFHLLMLSHRSFHSHWIKTLTHSLRAHLGMFPAVNISSQCSCCDEELALCLCCKRNLDNSRKENPKSLYFYLVIKEIPSFLLQPQLYGLFWRFSLLFKRNGFCYGELSLNSN